MRIVFIWRGSKDGKFSIVFFGSFFFFFFLLAKRMIMLSQ